MDHGGGALVVAVSLDTVVLAMVNLSSSSPPVDTFHFDGLALLVSL